MICCPTLLRIPAIAAGIKTPKRVKGYDRDAFPHFTVYVAFQKGRPIRGSRSHFTNAEVIAKIPDDQICNISLEEIEKMEGIV